MLVTVIRNSLLLLSVTIIAFVLLQDNLGLLTPAVQHAKPEQTESPNQSSNPEDYTSSDPSELVVEADSRGHFFVTADIGGRNINFLVDTGASQVALTQEDADTIGYPVHQLDYSGRANTANGVARFAPITIEEIAIGDNVVSNVRGHIVDAPLHISLLGMTFLRKLASFEIKNNRLHLRWR